MHRKMQGIIYNFHCDICTTAFSNIWTSAFLEVTKLQEIPADNPLYEMLPALAPTSEFWSIYARIYVAYLGNSASDTSSESHLRISSATNIPQMSSNLVFAFPTKLLMAILIAPQLFGNEANIISAQTSSSNSISISTNDSWFVMC